MIKLVSIFLSLCFGITTYTSAANYTAKPAQTLDHMKPRVAIGLRLGQDPNSVLMLGGNKLWLFDAESETIGQQYLLEDQFYNTHSGVYRAGTKELFTGISSSIWVFDSETGSKLRSVSTMSGGLEGLFLSKDGKYLYTVTDIRVRKYDLEKNPTPIRGSNELWTYDLLGPSEKKNLYGAIDFSPESNLLAAATARRIKILNAAGKLRYEIGTATMCVGMHFGPNGKKLYFRAAREDRGPTLLMVFDTETGEVREIELPDLNRAWKIRAYPGDQTVYVAGSRSDYPVEDYNSSYIWFIDSNTDEAVGRFRPCIVGDCSSEEKDSTVYDFVVLDQGKRIVANYTTGFGKSGFAVRVFNRAD